MRGVTAQGSNRTEHSHAQYGTLQVLESFKGSLPEKLTTVTDLKTPEGGYIFELQKTYLVFAKKLPREGEFSAAGACSIQPTVPIEKAKNLLAQLKRNKNGGDKIDCNSIRPKKNAAGKN